MTRFITRGLASVGAAGLLMGAAPAVSSGGAAQPVCAAAAAPYHVSLVIRHSDSEPKWRICVAFDSSTPTFDPQTRSITGEEVLALSVTSTGPHPTYQTVDFGGSLGRALCQVDNQPSTPAGGFTQGNCFGSPYWMTWTSSQGGGWMSATSGITNEMYADGDAEGLSYGQPGPASPSGICPPPQPLPQPTPSSRASPVPVASPVGTSDHATPSVPAAATSATSPVPSTTPDAANGTVATSPQASPPAVNPSRASGTAPGSGAFAPPLGWVATAVAAMALLGLLAVQLVGRRGT